MKYYPQAVGKQAQIPEMTGGDLVLSGTRADFGQTGQPVVLLQFTNHGSDQFQKITREEADRGKLRFTSTGSQGDYKNYVQHFAIVLDGQLESTPYIDFKQNPDGIAGPERARSTSARAARSRRRRTSRWSSRPVRCR